MSTVVKRCAEMISLFPSGRSGHREAIQPIRCAGRCQEQYLSRRNIRAAVRANAPGPSHFRGLKARRQAKGIRWRPPDHDQSRSFETRCCIPDGETDNGRSLNLSEISSDGVRLKSRSEERRVGKE